MIFAKATMNGKSVFAKSGSMLGVALVCIIGRGGQWKKTPWSELTIQKTYTEQALIDELRTYVENFYSDIEIARSMGITKGIVFGFRNTYGIPNGKTFKSKAILEALKNTAMGLDEIADKFEANRNTIASMKWRHGMHDRPKKNRSSVKPHAERVNAMIANGLSDEKIAKAIGLTEAAVRYYRIKTLGVIRLNNR
jgi:DNA-binding CsgD family transcriptional regulator